MPEQEKPNILALNQEQLFYTIPQAAHRLNVSEKTIRRWIYRGLLTPSNALYKKLIPRKQVENFYERAEKLLAA
jgi:excisionase family DNA binding protein